jgi:hypothetical protein
LINANNLLDFDLFIAVVFLQVYGSNNGRILLVSAIRGPCEVLHVDKFREETKRRCQLDSSVCRLHPIFFCRSVSYLLIFSITLFSQQMYFFAKLSCPMSCGGASTSVAPVHATPPGARQRQNRRNPSSQQQLVARCTKGRQGLGNWWGLFPCISRPSAYMICELSLLWD